MRKKVRVLGVGSPSGDDQAGWLTVDILWAARLPAAADVIIEKLDRPGASLIPLLQDASWVILVDAMLGGGAPGRVSRFDAHDWNGYRHGLSGHGFGVRDALALAQALDCLPPRLDVYGIEIAAAAPGGAPGAAVQAAARQVAQAIAARLQRLRGPRAAA